MQHHLFADRVHPAEQMPIVPRLGVVAEVRAVAESRRLVAHELAPVLACSYGLGEFLAVVGGCHRRAR